MNVAYKYVIFANENGWLIYLYHTWRDLYHIRKAVWIESLEPELWN